MAYRRAMNSRRWTRRAEKWLSTNIRWTAGDREMVFLAAQKEGVHQSAFIRSAIRERAVRVLQSPDDQRILDPEDLV